MNDSIIAGSLICFVDMPCEASDNVRCTAGHRLQDTLLGARGAERALGGGGFKKSLSTGLWVSMLLGISCTQC